MAGAGLREVQTHSWANGSQLGLTNTHTSTHKLNHVLCADSTLPDYVYLLYPVSFTPLSFLSCPLALTVFVSGFTFLLHHVTNSIDQYLLP